MAEARAERRLAAILATDVVGYSRLMGGDEEGTLAALKFLRKSLIDPKIAEYRGRIFKTTGDGALVEFASTVDAVRCAIDIQRAIPELNADTPPGKKLEFRIGINVGEIIIAEDGDIFGDGVNIAARLEALAGAGGICVSARRPGRCGGTARRRNSRIWASRASRTSRARCGPIACLSRCAGTRHPTSSALKIYIRARAAGQALDRCPGVHQHEQ